MIPTPSHLPSHAPRRAPHTPRRGLWISSVALAALMCVLIPGCKEEIAGGQADGQRIFAEACARCHGPRGVPPPEMAMQHGVKDLTQDAVQVQLSEDELRTRIAEGTRGMPGFVNQLSAQQLDAVTRYVKTLRP